jgi:hypothetical protein
MTASDEDQNGAGSDRGSQAVFVLRERFRVRAQLARGVLGRVEARL